MAQSLRLTFANLEALKDIWDKQLKRSKLFIPSKRTCPVGMPLRLTLTTGGTPAPLVLDGKVQMVREEQHCAEGQQPGFEVGFRYDRAQRKALRAYMKGDWVGAMAVLPEEARDAMGADALSAAIAREAEATRKKQEVDTSRAGSVVSVKRVKASKSGRAFLNLDPSADDFLERLEQEAVRQLARFEGKNHYEVMGLRPSASRKQIRSRYLQWMKLFHPDRYFRRLERGVQGSLEEVYQRVTVAYEVLVDDLERAQYDQDLSGS